MDVCEYKVPTWGCPASNNLCLFLWLLSMSQIVDPLHLITKLWPHITLYDKQIETIYSVHNNDETVVPAGNKLGKDFVSALICLTFFLSRLPCRIVTTSVDQGQLEKVLWGEINNLVQTAKYELPLVVKHLDIRRLYKGKEDPKSYLIGRVAAKEEGLLGHHLARNQWGDPTTLIVYDESSGIPHGFKEKTDTWAHRTLIIGNPFPCENFFKHLSKQGDVVDENNPGRFYIKKIKIKGEDSPNVQYAVRQQQLGLEPDDKILVPGLLTWGEYCKRRALWDKIRQCISLDAEFYEGSEVLLYPPTWLDRAETIWNQSVKPRVNSLKAAGIGVDPAEGGDSTAMAAVSPEGLLELYSVKTPDTSEIPGLVLAFAKKWNCPDHQILFDSGGGGKQIADMMRKKGSNVRSISFGEAASNVDRFKPMKTKTERKEDYETRYTYKNKRAELWGLLRRYLDPSEGHEFGLPPHCVELRRQMAPIPLTYDDAGRLFIISKSRKKVMGLEKERKANEGMTIADLIGCSPDEVDALSLAIYSMVYRGSKKYAGALI